MKTSTLKRIVIMMMFILSLFIQITAEYYYEINNIKNLNNELYGDNAITFTCSNTLNLKEVNKSLPSKSIIYNEIMFDNNQSIRAVFLNYDSAVTTLIDGRFFSVDDILTEKRVAVVGKNVICSKKNRKKYVCFRDIQYEVIGTLGSKNADSKMDNVILIPLTQDIINHLQKEFTIGYADYNQVITFLSNENLFGDVFINSVNRPNILKSVNINNKQAIIPILLIIQIFLVVIFTTVEWLISRKKEFYIKRINGYKSKQLFAKSVLEYEIMCSVPTFISVTMITIANGLCLENIIKNFIFVIVMCSIYLAVILIIWKINKKRII